MDVLGPSHPVPFIPGTLVGARRLGSSPALLVKCRTAAPRLGRALGCRVLKSSGKQLYGGPRVPLGPEGLLEREGTVFLCATGAPKPGRISARAELRGCIPHRLPLPLPHFLSSPPFFFPFPFNQPSGCSICFINTSSIPLSFPSPCWQSYRHLIAIQTPVTFGCHCGCCHPD